MADPIYDTTASNSAEIHTETHKPGSITGSLDSRRTGFPCEYMEWHKHPDEERYKYGFKEFPSASAGVGTNDN